MLNRTRLNTTNLDAVFIDYSQDCLSEACKDLFNFLSADEAAIKNRKR